MTLPELPQPTGTLGKRQRPSRQLGGAAPGVREVTSLQRGRGQRAVSRACECQRVRDGAPVATRVGVVRHHRHPWGPGPASAHSWRNREAPRGCCLWAGGPSHAHPGPLRGAWGRKAPGTAQLERSGLMQRPLTLKGGTRQCDEACGSAAATCSGAFVKGTRGRRRLLPGYACSAPHRSGPGPHAGPCRHRVHLRGLAGPTVT